MKKFKNLLKIEFIEFYPVSIFVDNYNVLISKTNL